MRKEDLDQCLKESWAEPQALRNLQAVASRVEAQVCEESLKEALYDLMATVLFMAERLREVELRVAGGSPVEENTRVAALRAMAVRKERAQGNHQPTAPDYDPTEREWKF